ncbi:MAG TPA: winged helix-turn-helix domain-containing protein, partial [Methanosarcina sp.]|nr:winged helix-turn-helix domain-containing protein [Methanosarcina sp.]
GIKGLKTKGQPGPKSQLSAKDRERIRVAIIKGADAFGHQSSLWTLERIAGLIRKMTKAKFQTTQTWRIVTSLGFSCQKPALTGPRNGMRKRSSNGEFILSRV